LEKIILFSEGSIYEKEHFVTGTCIEPRYLGAKRPNGGKWEKLNSGRSAYLKSKIALESKKNT
jgi:hypothetical protein